MSLLQVMDAEKKRRLVAAFDELEPRLRAAFHSGSERELLTVINEVLKLFGREEEKFT